MQRKIEFRGKHIYTQEWYFGCLLECEGNTVIRDKVRHEEHGYFTHPVIPETVGQFTGLKDKNGVEIYEDDIVLKKIIRGYDLNQKIVATMKSDFKTEYPWSDGNASGIVQCEYEVIGNIYENPELI